MNDKARAYLQKYKPMTKAQLKVVVADYAGALSDWKLAYDRTALVRSFGPVQQMIWFQALRTGDYRPTHGISALVLRDAHIRMLPQILDVRNRESSQKQHAARMPNMLVAMEQQFQPDIRKPLDIAEVLALCEAEAGAMPDTTNNMAMLAILNAWLGRDGDALEYCERMQHCPLPTLAPMPEWEASMRTFGRYLAKAVRAGTAREFLESATEETQAR
jgi:hypothetical protein